MSKYRRRLAMIRQYYEDFQEVEYIENTSTAYIHTNHKTKANTIIELDVQITTIDVQARIIGNASGYFESYINGSSRFAFASNGLLYSSGINANTLRHIFKLDNTISKGYIDDTEVKITKNASKYYNTIYLIARGGNNNLKCKIYGCKIYDGTALVRDYIPMYRKSTKEYGLWDKVEGKFYLSPNGVSFIGGAEVVRDINDNIYYLKEYVGARGYYSYVDTGIKGASTDVIKISVMTTSRPSTGWCWLIGYQKSESDRFGIYHRGSDNQYRFIVDFWRGNSGISRHYSNVYPYLNRRYDLVVGNDTLDTTNKGFMYDERSNVFILPKYRTINTSSSNDSYCVSENRAPKAHYYNRYYNVEIYKEINNKKVLVLHYIPTQRVEDGIYGFFDTVTKTFHPSQGSEQFTGG